MWLLLTVMDGGDRDAFDDDVELDLTGWHERVRHAHHQDGYRTGLDKGRELTLQHGFNEGYTDAFSVSYKCAYLRGVLTATLGDQLKNKTDRIPAGKVAAVEELIEQLSATETALKTFKPESADDLDYHATDASLEQAKASRAEAKMLTAESSEPSAQTGDEPETHRINESGVSDRGTQQVTPDVSNLETQTNVQTTSSNENTNCIATETSDNTAYSALKLRCRDVIGASELLIAELNMAAVVLDTIHD